MIKKLIITLALTVIYASNLFSQTWYSERLSNQGWGPDITLHNTNNNLIISYVEDRWVCASTGTAFNFIRNILLNDQSKANNYYVSRTYVTCHTSQNTISVYYPWDNVVCQIFKWTCDSGGNITNISNINGVDNTAISNFVPDFNWGRISKDYGDWVAYSRGAATAPDPVLGIKKVMLDNTSEVNTFDYQSSNFTWWDTDFIISPDTCSRVDYSNNNGSSFTTISTCSAKGLSIANLGNTRHVAYYNTTDNKMNLMTISPGPVVNISAFDSITSYDAISNTKIIVDNSSNVYVSYYDGSYFKYAKRISGVWSTHNIINGYKYGGLVVDSSGVVHTACANNTLEAYGHVPSRANIYYLCEGNAISGTLFNPDSTPAVGVRINMSGYISTYTYTNASGVYSFIVPQKQNYNISFTSMVWYRNTIGGTPVVSTFNFVTSDSVNTYIRDNTAPGLTYVSQAGYITDGINPDINTSTVAYTYKVKYTDTHSDPPATGFPRLKIFKGAQIYALLPMNYESGVYDSGAVYSTATLLSPCSYYSYRFEANDLWNVSATNVNNSGPSVKSLISGKVYYPNNVTMPCVTVTLTNTSVLPNTYTLYYTSGDGIYSFGYLESNSNYVISASSTAYYGFSPSSITFNNLIAITTGQDIYRTNVTSLSWTHETNYESDGINPEQDLTGGQLFSYRIKYFDPDNDAPMAGYPRVRILAAGATIYDSPMSEVGSSEINYITGKTYFYSTTVPSLKNLSYYFVSIDTFGTVYYTSQKYSPVISTSPPTLYHPNELGYTTDGFEPNHSSPAAVFTFKITYKDTDSDAPLSGYPKLHIKNNGTELAYSPFTMSKSSYSTFDIGVVYYTTVAINNTSKYYTYYFETYDEYNKGPVTTTETPSIFVNTNPLLSYTNDAGYTSDCLEPNISDTNTTYYFKVKYTDVDNDDPDTGYPKLHLLLNNTEIIGKAMIKSSGQNTTGAVYATSVYLSTGSTAYSYYIDAYDVIGGSCTTSTQPGPAVSNSIPIISNTSVNYNVGTTTYNYIFTAQYNDPDNDAPMAGFPELLILLNGTTIYSAAMTYSTGTYFGGATYNSEITISTASNLYTWKVISKDIWGWPSIEVVNNGPKVSGNIPTLEYYENTPAYFLPKTSISFGVKYTDPDNDSPADQYPKLHLSRNGVEILITSMTCIAGINTWDTGAVFNYNLTISSMGIYAYYYETADKYNYRVFTATKTIIIGTPPSKPSTHLKNYNGVVTTEKITLGWEATDEDANDTVKYLLYMSNGVDTQRYSNSIHSKNIPNGVVLSLLYSGGDTSYSVTRLDSGKIYFWRVDAEDINGLVTSGDIQSFQTANVTNNVMYNFPNPFNPLRQGTNVVFYSSENTEAKIYVYDELGKQLYDDTVNVMTGSNIYKYDGKDRNGNMLLNGSYIFKIKIGGISKDCILLIVK